MMMVVVVYRGSIKMQTGDDITDLQILIDSRVFNQQPKSKPGSYTSTHELFLFPFSFIVSERLYFLHIMKIALKCKCMTTLSFENL